VRAQEAVCHSVRVIVPAVNHSEFVDVLRDGPLAVARARG
jgi:hypothetical protein